jgi:hypothetical protein
MNNTRAIFKHIGIQITIFIIVLTVFMYSTTGNLYTMPTNTAHLAVIVALFVSSTISHWLAANDEDITN